MSAPVSPVPNLCPPNEARRPASRALARAPHPLIALTLLAALVAVVVTVRPPQAPPLRLQANTTSAAVLSGHSRVMHTTGPGVVSSRLYRAAAYVRASRHAAYARLQLRQIQNGRIVMSRTTLVTASTRATRGVVAQFVPKAGGGYLQAVAYASGGSSTAVVRFASVSVGSYSRSSFAAPACTSNIKGLPAYGTAYAGQTASGTVSLSSRESSYGRTVAVHRVYAQWNNIDSAVRIAADDVARKRVPWISFTVPSTWANMAAGRYDSWVNTVISKLNAVNGPVWLVFAHEPEYSRNQQNVKDWVRMQQRLLSMVKAKSDNIATSIIVMGYWQVVKTNPSLTLDALWPGDGKVDVIGMDSYNFYGTRQGGDGKWIWDMTDLRPWFKVFSDFAKAHQARWGVSETGYTDAAAQKDVSWITDTYGYLKSYGGVAMSYFDTSLNTGGFTWPLTPAYKRNQWGKAVAISARMC